MTKLYRIYTQRKNVKWIASMVSEYFNGFTILKGTGYWRGQKEKSLIIEIATDSAAAEHHVHEICQKINGYNRQNCVMVQKTMCSFHFV